MNSITYVLVLRGTFEMLVILMAKLAMVTKKDFLSNLAGLGIFVGMVITAGCEYDIIDTKFKKYGTFFAYIGGTSAALLIGKNPSNLKISDTNGLCTNPLGCKLPDGTYVKYGECLDNTEYKTNSELLTESTRDAIPLEDIPKVIAGAAASESIKQASAENQIKEQKQMEGTDHTNLM